MRRVMVRYRVKADKAEENVAYVMKVFEELHAQQPDGLRYATFRLDDGVSFIHFASIETDDGTNPLAATDAFKEFQKEIKDRCEEGPTPVDLHTVGAYRAFGHKPGNG